MKYKEKHLFWRAPFGTVSSNKWLTKATKSRQELFASGFVHPKRWETKTPKPPVTRFIHPTKQSVWMRQVSGENGSEQKHKPELTACEAKNQSRACKEKWGTESTSHDRIKSFWQGQTWRHDSQINIYNLNKTSMPAWEKWDWSRPGRNADKRKNHHRSGRDFIWLQKRKK